jgi:hypothetical protein
MFIKDGVDILWEWREEYADEIICWVDGLGRISVYCFPDPTLMLRSNKYVGNSISKLQIQVAS